MKSARLTLPAGLSLASLLCLISGQSAAGADKVSARTVAKPETRQASIVTSDIPVIEVPKSVFVVDFNNRQARDPFFPNASYVKPTVVNHSKPDAKPSLDSTALKSLKLTGMGGVGDNRWAMVNNITLYLGESAKIPVDGKLLQIECIEMDEKTVSVGIKGTSVRKQLKLD